MVKRYELNTYAQEMMEEDENGEWVKYDDFNHLMELFEQISCERQLTNCIMCERPVWKDFACPGCGI